MDLGEEMSQVFLVVTARMGSSRFPGKPLAMINGMPMLHWVMNACSKSKLASRVVLATPDEEIEKWGADNGWEVCKTSHDHERATDRMAEVATKNSGSDRDIFVLVQGDEPTISSNHIDQAIVKLQQNQDAYCVNLVSKITDKKEKSDVNCVKAICSPSQNDEIYWFTRAGVPYDQNQLEFEKVAGYKQVCIIPFWRITLEDFSSTPATPHEEIESIDMLRVIETGRKVKCAEIFESTHPVDVIEDVQIVEEIMKDKKYV